MLLKQIVVTSLMLFLLFVLPLIPSRRVKSVVRVRNRK